MIKLRGYGGKGGGRAAVEGENTLRSTQEAEVIELLSEGQIVGFVAPNGETRVGDDILKSIYLNEIPILNEDGAPNYQNTELEFDYRLGTQSQTPLNGFADAGQRTTFKADNTSEIKSVYPNGISQIVNNPDLQIRTIEVILGIPQFYQQNKKTGDTTAVTVALELWLKSGPNGSFVKVQDINLTGKTTSRFQQPYTIQIDGSQTQYTVQVRRITPDRGGSTEVDPDFVFADSVFFDAYTVIRSQQLSYPNSAVTRLRVKSDQFSSIPSRAYLIKGIQVKVPTNYNANAIGNRFVGTWDGQFKTEWTDNPAWIYYDLLTNTRYGIGEFINSDQINKWALYEIGKYCDDLVPDGFGGVERRFSCNTWLTSAEDVYSALNNFASIFRGMQFWAAGKLVAQADMPRDPVAHFTQANVISGQFTYSGTSLKSRHTVAQVVWNDPQDFYRQKVEYVEDQQAVARWGIVTLEITAVGCTSRGQAHRLGKWALYTDQYETETVSFQTSLESAILAPGDVIEIADSNRHFGRYGGRIKSISGSQITLDSTVPNGSYTLYVLAEDTDQANRHLAPKLTEITGTVVDNIFTAPSPITGAEPNMVWTVSGNGYEKEQWRILSITEDSPGIVNITALEYWPTKYDYVENGLRLQPRYGNSGSPGTGNLGPGLDTPTVQGNWYIEYLYYSGPSVLSTGVTVSWTGNSPKYIVSYRRKAIPIAVPGVGIQWVNDVWRTVESETNSIDIKPIAPAVYDIKIVGVNNAGTMTQPCEAEMTIFGKAAPPADVTSITAELGVGGVNLSWGKIQDLDLKHYELRRFKDSGGSWATATVVGENITATTFIDSEVLEPGVYTYYVKAVDTSGNYSTNPASTTLDISSGASNITGLAATSASGGVVLTWTNPNSLLVAIKHIEILYSLVNDFSTATTLGTTTGEGFKAELEAGETWYFWARILDRNGNLLPEVGPVSAVSLEKALKTSRVFLFQWSSVKPGNPTGVQTYTWSTNSLSPYTGINGWSNTFGPNPGGSSVYLWVAAQSITTEEQNTTSLVNWANPSVSVYRSENGEEGDFIQSAEIKVYKLDLTIPAGPTGTSTYTWSTGNFSDPSGWTKTIPAPAPGTTLYSASLRLVDSANAATTPINWVTAAVRPEAYNGANGGNPITIDLLSEADVVPALADGSGFSYPTNQIRLYLGNTLITSGITYSYTSSVVGVVANIDSSGNVTFSGSWNTDKVEFIFTATYDSVPYSTAYVIAKSKKGDSAVFADLISENLIVPTNTSGGGYTLPSGNALRLYSGGEQLTSGINYRVKTGPTTYATSQNKNGLTCAINSSGAITLSGASWNTDAVTFELAAQYNSVWYTHILTVAKAKQGATGVGTAGPQGASYRTAYARFGNVNPVSGTVTTIGNTDFPNSSQSNSAWSMNITWYGNDPLPSSSNSLYQTDGIYNPVTNETTWYTPYLSSLKVGTLSAITANTGSLNVSTSITAGSSPPVVSSSTYYDYISSGAGFRVNSSGQFAIGNSNAYIVATTSRVSLGGTLSLGSSANSTLSISTEGTVVGNHTSNFHLTKAVGDSNRVLLSATNTVDDAAPVWIHKGISSASLNYISSGGNAVVGVFSASNSTSISSWKYIGSLASGNTYAAVRGQAFNGADLTGSNMYAKGGWFSRFKGTGYSSKGNINTDVQLATYNAAIKAVSSPNSGYTALFRRLSTDTALTDGVDIYDAYASNDAGTVAINDYSSNFAIRATGTNPNIGTTGLFFSGSFSNSTFNGFSVVFHLGHLIAGGASDIRLKNIEDADTNPGLGALLKFQPITYSWKNDDTHRKWWGFSAQQVKSIVPELVESTNEEAHLAIRELQLIPILVKAVQELSAQVEELKKKLNV